MLRDLKLADGLTDLLTFSSIVFLVRHRLQVVKTASTNSVRLGGTIRQCGLQKQKMQIELIDHTTASNIYTLRHAKHELEMVQNVLENTPFRLADR